MSQHGRQALEKMINVSILNGGPAAQQLAILLGEWIDMEVDRRTALCVRQGTEWELTIAHRSAIQALAIVKEVLTSYSKPPRETPSLAPSE